MANRRISHGKAVGQLVCVQNMGEKDAPEHEYVGVATFQLPTGKGFGLVGLGCDDYNGLLDFVGKTVLISYSGECLSDDPLLIQLDDQGIKIELVT